MVALIGNKVVNPECGIEVEVVEVALTLTVTVGHLVNAAIHGHKHCRVSIVNTKPNDTSYWVGKPRTHLCAEHEASLLSCDCALVAIGNTVDLKFHWAIAIRNPKVVLCAWVLSHVIRCALEVVAHHVLHVAHAQQAVGFHIKWHDFGAFLTLKIRQVAVHASSILIEERPCTGIAATQGAIVGRAVSEREVEVLILAVEPTHLAGKRHNVLAIHAVVFILKWNLVNAGLISVSRDTIVGNANGNPHGAFLLAALTNHLEYPNFVRVTHRERLALAAVTILSHKVGHDLKGLAGSRCALQGDVDETTIVDSASCVFTLMASAPSRLSDCHLVLIDIAYHFVGVSHLGNLT